jgi:alanine-glyoxylate transaminase/(R)-3-amino-2-methylpropionate-pyruvate transaminase
VIPDIVVMGKGISNGFPLSAVVMKRPIAESMAQKRFFNTYGANPVGCAAGRAVLRIIDEEELQENAKQVGEQMLKGLRRLQAKHDIVGDVRGRGLMIGVELVKDRATKEPATAETGRVFEATKKIGLIMGRSGIHKNILRISPPLCIQTEDVEFFLEGMDSSFGAL